MTKIDLVTGILGAGKTTFLLRYGRYLLQKGERIAILVNDFGAVNVDTLLLSELKCDRCEIETICGCGDPNAYRRRYRTKLIALGMQHFDRVLIEPSGIFDMDEFFDALYESPLDKWYEIGSVLTILDAEMDDKRSDQMEFLLGSEAASAGRLVLSKLSSVQDEPLPALTERILGYVNRALTYIQCDRRFTEKDLLVKDWDTLTDADFAALESAGYRGSSYVKLFSPQTIRSSVHYFMHLHFPEAQIAEIVRGAMDDPACGKLYRIKGSLPSDHGGWRKINVTREKTEISPVADGQAVLIAIGDDLDLERLDAHFRAANTDPEYVSI